MTLSLYDEAATIVCSYVFFLVRSSVDFPQSSSALVSMIFSVFSFFLKPRRYINSGNISVHTVSVAFLTGISPLQNIQRYTRQRKKTKDNEIISWDWIPQLVLVFQSYREEHQSSAGPSNKESCPSRHKIFTFIPKKDLTKDLTNSNFN